MKARFYLGWCNKALPEKLADMLRENIADRKSLVMISADPSGKDEGEAHGVDERSWLDKAGIVFGEYHLVDYRMPKAEAQKLVEDASVIFLLGGNVNEQNTLLAEYGLSGLIKNSDAVVVGTSAGAMNMSAKAVCLTEGGCGIESCMGGIGLDRLSVQSHSGLGPEGLLEGALFPLSEQMNVYVTDENCGICIRRGKIDIAGDVHLISHSAIHKLESTR